jgi:L-lactate dehydrogenase complex protein LldG
VSGAVEAFARAFRRAGGEVVLLADRDAASEWLAGFAGEHASSAVAADVEAALRPRLPDAPAAEAALGVSRAVGAAADTGTLLLDSRRGRGLQLLPPTHLVWVEAATVRSTLEEAMEDARGAELPPVLALHSGPSKSADIGQIVVTGVHGPGRVVAAVVGAAPPAPPGSS